MATIFVGGNIGTVSSDNAPLVTSSGVNVSPSVQGMTKFYNSAIWWWRSTDDTPSYQKRAGVEVFLVFDSATVINWNGANYNAVFDSVSGLYYFHYIVNTQLY